MDPVAENDDRSGHGRGIVKATTRGSCTSASYGGEQGARVGGRPVVAAGDSPLGHIALVFPAALDREHVVCGHGVHVRAAGRTGGDQAGGISHAQILPYQAGSGELRRYHDSVMPWRFRVVGVTRAVQADAELSQARRALLARALAQATGGEVLRDVILHREADSAHRGFRLRRGRAVST